MPVVKIITLFALAALLVMVLACEVAPSQTNNNQVKEDSSKSTYSTSASSIQANNSVAPSTTLSGGGLLTPTIITPEALTPGTNGLNDPTEREEAMIELCKANLAQRLGVSRNSIKLVSITSEEFGDVSLGCPQPGFVYAQVITPGYVVILQADSRNFEYHTDKNSLIVLCEPMAGASVPTTIVPGDMPTPSSKPTGPLTPNTSLITPPPRD